MFFCRRQGRPGSVQLKCLFLFRTIRSCDRLEDSGSTGSVTGLTTRASWPGANAVPRELGLALGVSESSLKRWIERQDHRDADRRGAPGSRFARGGAGSSARPTRRSRIPRCSTCPRSRSRTSRGVRTDRLLPYLETGDAAGARGWLLRAISPRPSSPSCATARSARRCTPSATLAARRGRRVRRATAARNVCLQALAYLRGHARGTPGRADRARRRTRGRSGPVALVHGVDGRTAAGLRAITSGPTRGQRPAAGVPAHQPRLVWISASTKLAPARAREIAHWIRGTAGRRRSGWSAVARAIGSPRLTPRCATS